MPDAGALLVAGSGPLDSDARWKKSRCSADVSVTCRSHWSLIREKDTRESTRKAKERKQTYCVRVHGCLHRRKASLSSSVLRGSSEATVFFSFALGLPLFLLYIGKKLTSKLKRLIDYITIVRQSIPKWIQQLRPHVCPTGSGGMN